MGRDLVADLREVAAAVVAEVARNLAKANDALGRDKAGVERASAAAERWATFGALFTEAADELDRARALLARAQAYADTGLCACQCCCTCESFVSDLETHAPDCRRWQAANLERDVAAYLGGEGRP